MHVTPRRTEIILNHLQEKHYLECCSHYGEPGYQDPETGILFANWNPVPAWIGTYLEEAGYELEWSDEWYVDYDNDKAWRTSPDSYGWVQQIRFTDDGEIITPDDGPQAMIEYAAMTTPSQPSRVVPDWVEEADIKDLGYVAINGDFESGFPPGQNDDPKAIAKKAFDAGAESVVFRLKGAGQFDITFQGFALYPTKGIDQ